MHGQSTDNHSEHQIFAILAQILYGIISYKISSKAGICNDAQLKLRVTFTLRYPIRTIWEGLEAID